MKNKARSSSGDAVDRQVERAAAEAERLYSAAVRLYEGAIPVICNPKIDRAAESLKEAGRKVKKAMRLLAKPICRRLGLVRSRDARALCSVLHDFGSLDIMVGDNSPGMLEHVLKNFPERRRFDKWLIDDGRAVLDEFHRVGLLDRDSDVYRRLQALVRIEFERLLPERDERVGRRARRNGRVVKRHGARR